MLQILEYCQTNLNYLESLTHLCDASKLYQMASCGKKQGKNFFQTPCRVSTKTAGCCFFPRNKKSAHTQGCDDVDSFPLEYQIHLL